VGNEFTTLYRFFDGQDCLLYVGISGWLPVRLEQHASSKQWWWQVRRCTMDHFPSREAALTAEADAINAEHPLYNVAGRPKHMFWDAEWNQLCTLEPRLLELQQAIVTYDPWRHDYCCVAAYHGHDIEHPELPRFQGLKAELSVLVGWARGSQLPEPELVIEDWELDTWGPQEWAAHKAKVLAEVMSIDEFIDKYQPPERPTSEPEWLHSSEAYEMALHRLVNLLPPCLPEVCTGCYVGDYDDCDDGDFADLMD
jgi:hypothetical protein